MGSNVQETFVTERLAGGLARQAIREWRAQVVQSRQRMLDLVGRRLTTSKGVNRVVRDTHRMLDPLAFQSAQVELKRKGVQRAWLFPGLAMLDEVEYLAIELDLYAVNLAGFRPLGARYLGFIHPHALARMFLRMQTTAFAAVRAEIDSTLKGYAAFAEACRALGLRQMIIPTVNGYFRCDVRPDVMEPCALVAKTWIAARASGRRDLAALESIIDVLFEWTERATEDERSQLAVPIKGPETLVAQLVEALRAHPWLAEPYSQREDPLADIWEAARRQADDEET